MTQMFSNCNNLSNATLINIAKMCINAPLVTYKNLHNGNSYSPFRYSNKQINVNTVGANLINQLQAHG